MSSDSRPLDVVAYELVQIGKADGPGVAAGKLCDLIEQQYDRTDTIYLVTQLIAGLDGSYRYYGGDK